jgi:nicotinate-nucleotide--dimethylbenzimidazole phosphoribosyltransferase
LVGLRAVQFLGEAADIQDLEDFGELDQALHGGNAASEPLADPEPSADPEASADPTPAPDTAAAPAAVPPAAAHRHADEAPALVPGEPALPSTAELEVAIGAAATAAPPPATSASSALEPGPTSAAELKPVHAVAIEPQESDWLGDDLLPKGLAAETGQAAAVSAAPAEDGAGAPEGEQDAGPGSAQGAAPQPAAAELLPSGTEVEEAIESAAADVVAAGSGAAGLNPAADPVAAPPLQTSAAPADAAPGGEARGGPGPDPAAPEPGRAADSARVVAAAVRGLRLEDRAAEAGQPDAQTPAAERNTQAEASAEAADQAELAAGAADAAEFVLSDEPGDEAAPKGAPASTAGAAAERGTGALHGGETEKADAAAEGLTPGERLLQWEEALVATPTASLLGSSAARPAELEGVPEPTGSAHGPASGHDEPESADGKAGAGGGEHGGGGLGARGAGRGCDQ